MRPGRQDHAAVDPLIAAQSGRIVGTAGDSLLADFPSVVDALNCALEMQHAVHALNDTVPPERRLELRIGVNLGDVIVDGDDIFGDGVNIAARLEALAKPGTVCISHTVYEHVKNKLDLGYRPLGRASRQEHSRAGSRLRGGCGGCGGHGIAAQETLAAACGSRGRCRGIGRSCCLDTRYFGSPSPKSTTVPTPQLSSPDNLVQIEAFAAIK